MPEELLGVRLKGFIFSLRSLLPPGYNPRARDAPVGVIPRIIFVLGEVVSCTRRVPYLLAFEAGKHFAYFAELFALCAPIVFIRSRNIGTRRLSDMGIHFGTPIS